MVPRSKNSLHIKRILPIGIFMAALGAIFFGTYLLIQNHKYQIQLMLTDEYRREELLSNVAATLQDFLTLTLGILVEALPFVILGVLVSVLIQTLVSTETLLKRLPRHWLPRRLTVSFLGVLMPVCECGNVPVARSLIMKGISVQESIIFLLAAPSINIVTFVVTWEAFNINHSVAVVRVLATLVVANAAAFLVAKTISKHQLLTREFVATCEINNHIHRSWAKATELFRSEMWLITRMLVIGAMIAAASQTFIPRETIAAIGSNIFLSVVAMLILAFIISICSSVDAFFALAYANTFGLGSILAFLVAGPMVDIKMIALMKTTFTYRVLAVITAAVLLLTLCIGIGFSYVW